jgi:arabinofuranan 3-O-arabinosyltransferase
MLATRTGVDRVLLDDGHHGHEATVVDVPARTSPSSVSGSVPATTRSRLLVVAQGYDPRWRATAGGRDLGAPLEVNGYAIGWVLPAGSARDVHVWFAPQARYEVALGVSLVSVAGLAVLGVVLAWRRRRVARG